MNASLSRNTLAAYRSSWRSFCAWCEEAGVNSLPARVSTVSDFIVWSISKGYRVESCYARMSSIAYHHRLAKLPSPNDASVFELVNLAKRHLKERPAGMHALTPVILRKMLASFSDVDPIDVRNKAMLLVSFASGWRRSELVHLDLSDVQFFPAGMTLFQSSSKTDQAAKGRTVPINCGKKRSTCPVAALKRWLEIRGNWDGPLFVRYSRKGVFTQERFRNSGEVLYKIVKECLGRIGVDPTRYGAHSTRSGMITTSAENGADPISIMQRTGHRTMASVLRYVRPYQSFRNDPLAGVL